MNALRNNAKDRGHFILIAHRGGKEFGPENHLETLRKAISRGVTMVETDVRETLDHVLVIHHDAIIGYHVISRTSYAELKDSYSYLPTLKEFLEEGKGRCGFDLELKRVSPRLLFDLISSFNLQDIMITSFHQDLLQEMRALDENICIGILLNNHLHLRQVLFTADSLHVQALLPFHLIINQSLIDEAHSFNLKVIPWTVNNIQHLEELVHMGVDGVITDRYSEFKRYLSEKYHFNLIKFPT